MVFCSYIQDKNVTPTTQRNHMKPANYSSDVTKHHLKKKKIRQGTTYQYLVICIYIYIYIQYSITYINKLKKHSHRGQKYGGQRNPIGWGSSKSVPSVQELVRIDSHHIPQRYIQQQEHRPLDSSSPPVSDGIPIINLSLLTTGDEDQRQKLHVACRDWGFFQIIDHGIEDEVLLNMKSAVADFFEHPVTEKNKYAMAENDLQCYGQAYVASDQQKLDWNDMLFLMVEPTKFRNMKYWPTILPDFKNAVEEYSAVLEKVCIEIFANLSVLMGMKEDGLKELHNGIHQGFRMNYYPKCSRPDLVLGVSPHSDGGTITLLLQEDDITGLQIKHKGGWVLVTPVPNALVVNIGDTMEVWSNRMYKSIEHRAVTNEKRSRISVATFILPDQELILEPVKTMVDDYSRPRLYKGIKYMDYLRHTLSRKMDGKTDATGFLKLGNK